VEPENSRVCWSVALAGDQDYLRKLAAKFTDHDFQVVQKDASFSLTRSSWTTLDMDSVMKDARCLIEALKGANRLAEGFRREIEVSDSITETFPDGTSRIIVRFEEHLSLVDSMEIAVTDETGVVRVSTPLDRVDIYHRVSLADETAARVMRWYARDDRSWGTLYNLLEAVNSGSGLSIKMGWLSEADSKRLKHTAGSLKTVGDESRHGHESSDPPKKPMPLGEAISHVERCVSHYMLWKANELGLLDP